MDNSSDQVPKMINDWNLSPTSVRTVRCVERILHTMNRPALWALRDFRFQVIAAAKGPIWTYYPLYKNSWMGQQLPYEINPGVEAVLVIGEDTVEKHSQRMVLALLSHFFGHALRFLRNAAWHECTDADAAAREAGLTQLVLNSRWIYERHTRNFYRELVKSPEVQQFIEWLEESENA
jgi:hypothetical protein